MTDKQTFPPIDWLWRDYERCLAWYSGDHTQLRRHAIRTGSDPFWASMEDIKVHVPLAADIAALSAGMIFADSPKISCADDEKTEVRIEEIMTEAGIYSTLLQAAELASVFGGVFLKWSWDIADGFPRLSAVPANAGLPTWAGGKVVKIQFWSIVREDEQTGAIWRLEETYTPDGRIRSKLYRGDENDLGRDHELTAIEETKGIKPEAFCGAETMLAFYVPNILPNRKKPHLKFGRSDFDGLFGLFDELDEAYSAIQRETRMTKTTVIVPAEYLRKRDSIFGSGNPACRENQWVYANNTGAFTALDIDSDRQSSPITIVNPELRAESRLAVCDDLVRRILSMAGYAPQSAGLDISGSAESGTALNVRERKSIRTTETKKTYWWHALKDIIRAMLRLDAAVFRSGVNPEAEFSVELPANAQPDISQLAEVVEQLERAGAVSTETKVNMLHPDWSEEQRAEELERIRAEQNAAAAADIDSIFRTNAAGTTEGEEE